MKKCWNFFLYIILLAAIFAVFTTPAASENASASSDAALSPEVDSPHRGGVINEAFRYLTSMLGLLDVTLRLANSTLESYVSEYPFLAGTLEGTGQGVESIDSMLLILDMDQQIVNSMSLGEIEVRESPLNESFEEINSSLESSDLMLEAVNLTLGEDNLTADLLNSMYGSLKYMVGSAC